MRVYCLEQHQGIDLKHIMTSCTYFRERPSVDDIAEMKDVYVGWMSAVAVLQTRLGDELLRLVEFAPTKSTSLFTITLAGGATHFLYFLS